MRQIVQLSRKWLSVTLTVVLLLSSMLANLNIAFAEGDEDKINLSFSVNDIVEAPLKNVKVTVYSDSSMDNSSKLDSDKTDNDGNVVFTLDEIDVYYYRAEADDMKKVEGNVTKTSPEATITMIYMVDCHTCNGKGKVECESCDGTGKQINTDPCTDCGATGKVNSSTPCETCSGTGTVHDDGLNTDVDCTACNGTGLVSSQDDCPTCFGTGNVTSEGDCAVCNGTKKVNCPECSGTGSVEAYDYNASLITSVIRKSTDNTVISDFKDTKGNDITLDISDMTVSSDNTAVIAVDANGQTVSSKGKAGQSATVTVSIPFDKTNGYQPKIFTTSISILKSNDSPYGYTVPVLTYNGENQDLLGFETNADNIDVDLDTVQYTVTFNNDSETESSVSAIPTAKYAGLYHIVVTDNNHENSSEFDVEIQKAELTVNPVEGQTKEYGVIPEIDYTIDGVFNNEVTKSNFVGALIYDGFGAEELDTAGDHVINKGTLALDNENSINSNYSLKDANINPENTTIKVNDIAVGVSADLPSGFHTDKNTKKWYNVQYFGSNETVRINAPEGYEISKGKNNFSSYIDYSEEQDITEITIYIRAKIDLPVDDKGLKKYIGDNFGYEGTGIKEAFSGGVITKTTIEFGIDKTIPTLDNVEFEAENDNLLAAIGRLLTFGAFFNKQIVANVDTSDELSDVDTVSVFYEPASTDTSYSLETDDYKKFVFTNDTDTIKGLVYVTVVDNAGNKNEDNQGHELVTGAKSNMMNADCYVMIENTKPVFYDDSVTPNNSRESVYTVNEKAAYSGDVTFHFSVKDSDSGIYYSDIKINGVDFSQKYGTEFKGNATYDLSTEGITANEDGSYKIEASVSDAAGNFDKYEETVYVDRHSPIVKSFEITGLVGTSDDNQIPHSVEATTYGFYFQNSANVTVTFGDYAENNELLSGIKAVKIYLVDKDNGNTYEITKDGEMKILTSMDSVSDIPASSLKKVSDDSNDVRSFTFTVNKDFKGQIYAKAYDNVDNDLTNNASPTNAKSIIGDDLSFDSNGYQKPNGSIIESAEKHNSQEIPHITIKPTTPVVGKDNSGKDLYSTDVEVDIAVADTYSGIKSVDLSVVADYDTANNYNHSLSIGSSGNLSYTGNTGENDWAVGSTDQNLVTSVSNVITVKNDSNDISVNVSLTDRAGNVSTSSISFSIDKSKPIITVEYDNNSFENEKYYQDSRTATITVQELNFKEELVEKSTYKLDDSNVVITKILDGQNQNTDSSFKKSELKTVTDEYGKTTAYYEYKKTVECSIQGDYSLTLTATDNALNKADYDRTDEFSVDTAVPYIEVAFSPDTDNAANSGYFSSQRVATVTVTDRYFDATRTSIVIKSDDNGKTIDSPKPGAWSDQTEDYKQSSIVTFKNDGTYSFTVDATDLSGKVATQYTVGEFTIDNTDPTIKIYINKEEVKNGANLAFIDEVVPQVVVEDTNFSLTDTKVTLTPAVPKEDTNLNEQQTAISKDSEKKRENGMTYDFKNFDDEDGKTRKYDNIYTLTVETKDKAGRKIDPVSIRFSVNRFGSNYLNYESAVGAYFSKAPVIQVTEVNVNPIDFENEETFVEVTSITGETQHLKSKDVIIQTLEGTDKNWYEYHYAIPSKCFEVDDFYSIKLSSVDTAKRHSTNVNSEINDDDIYFTVDTTKPYFEVTNYKENDDSVHEDNFVLNLKLLDDTSGIKKYEVKFDGEVFETITKDKDFDNTVSLNIPISGAEKLSDAAGRNLEITVYDAAENNIKGETFSVRISTNFWVNALAKLQDFYHNTPAFWGTVSGVTVVAAASIAIPTVMKRRKRLNTPKA